MISVIVPTFNRPEGLTRAVESLFQQTYAETGFTIIIVDNTPDATAAGAISKLREACPKTIKLVTLHEPHPGVANARNLAMGAVSGNLVAFLDDDQSAPRDWLANLLAAQKQNPATVTFAPVRTRLPDNLTRHQRYFEDFFARDPGHASGYILASYGCGNALVDFAKIPGGAPWFDPKMNEMGGEDDVLFARIRAAGGLFAWAEEAPVFEHPPHDRLTLGYTLRRAFSYGQAPITMALKRTPKRYDLAALWMMVGLVKAIWHGLKWIGLCVFGRPGRAAELDRAVRGFSKLFWWIDLKFYGAAALKRAKPTPAAEPSVSAPSPKRV